MRGSLENSGSFLCGLLFASAFLRDQKRGESIGIFVAHGAVRFGGSRTQSLWIFHPLVDPGRGQARTDLSQGRTDISLVCFGVDDVASLARVLAIEKLLAEFHLAL